MQSLFDVAGFARRMISRLDLFLVLSILILLILFIMPGEAGADRFFQTNSTWYEPISNSPGDDPYSSGKIAWIRTYDSSFAANNNWAPTIWRASSSTPTTTVINKYCVKDPNSSGCTTNPPPWVTQGWNLNIPIPPGALPAQNAATLACWPNYCSDGKMIIISADGNTIWELGNGVYFPPDFTGVAPEYRGKYAATYLRRWDARGNGVNYPYDWLGAVDDGGVPLSHGLITHNEVVNTRVIDHAVAMTVKPDAVCQAAHNEVYPSGVYLYTDPFRTNTAVDCVKGGERLYLDSSVNCETISSNAMVKMVCRTLQTYGGIIMDFGDSSIYIENEYGKSWSWSGIKGDLSVIPTDKLRVSLPIYPRNTSSSPIPASKRGSLP
jgi:hypothetical protein